jgi:hypothetical protein
VSDVAVVRRIVERLAAVQEQIALDIATLQKSDQNVRQKVPLPPHSPAAVPPRKYAPSIARSDVVAHSPSVPVPTAPTRTPLVPHWPPALRLLGASACAPVWSINANAAQSGSGGSTWAFLAPGFVPRDVIKNLLSVTTRPTRAIAPSNDWLRRASSAGSQKANEGNKPLRILFPLQS